MAGFELNQGDNTAGTPAANQPADSTSQIWRAGYNQVAPIYGDTTALSAQTTGQTGGSWRAPYNQTAPIFQPGGQGQRTTYDGSNTPIYSAPQYDTTTGQPTAGNGAPYTPPYDQAPTSATPRGPAFNPGSDTSGNGSPPGQPVSPGDAGGNSGTAFNPGGNGGAAFNPGGNQGDGQTPSKGNGNTNAPVDTSTPSDTSPTEPIGVFPAAVMGGIGGAFGGSFAPRILNKMADGITSTSAKTGPGMFDEGGLAGKIFPKSYVDKAAELQGQMAAKAGDLGGGGMLQKAALGWQNNFDPRYIGRPQLQNLLDENTTALKGFEGKDVATLAETEANQFKQLQATQSVLAGADGKLNPALFTEGGKTSLQQLVEDGNASSALTKQIENLNKAFPDAPAAGTKTPLMERPGVSDFLKGAAFFGGTIAADKIVGNVIGSQNGAFHLDTIAIPEAFLYAQGDPKKMLIYGAASVIGSNVIDKIMPASEHTTMSRIFAPNAVDGVTMGAAFTLPAEDPRMRMAMVGGAYAFGRLRNMTGGEALATTGVAAALTGGAMYLSKLDTPTGVALLAGEGAAYLGSRIFHKL